MFLQVDLQLVKIRVCLGKLLMAIDLRNDLSWRGCRLYLDRRDIHLLMGDNGILRIFDGFDISLRLIDQLR